RLQAMRPDARLRRGPFRGVRVLWLPTGCVGLSGHWTGTWISARPRPGSRCWGVGAGNSFYVGAEYPARWPRRPSAWHVAEYRQEHFLPAVGAMPSRSAAMPAGTTPDLPVR